MADDSSVSSLPEGFAGRLSFRGADRLGYEETVSALQRLGMLVSWAQAQQARVAARLEVLFARDIAEASGREEPALAMSLAAAEASTVLNIPHMTAMQLISESTRLCTEAPDTLDRLAEGKIGLQHARIILEETHNLPANVPDIPEAGAVAGLDSPAADPSNDDSEQLELGLHEPDPDNVNGSDADADADAPGDAEALSVRNAFERDLLAEAEGRTAAGFGRRARRLRESRFPDLIPVRHREAKDKRRVMFQPLPDGMSCLSAIIAAEKGQAMFAALTSAAKAGKRAGDPRTMDQLRADTLTELLLEGEPAALSTDTLTPGNTPGSSLEAQSAASVSFGNAGPAAGPASGSGTGSGKAEPTDIPADSLRGTRRKGKHPRRAERHRNRNQNRSKVSTEVMVLINADTLAGLNENPAELNGYGPISAETARTVILEALHWTPLLQDPATGEILNVGRTRRIPAGLKRWLQARDGTCRFPGCSVSVTHAEIDHTGQQTTRTWNTSVPNTTGSRRSGTGKHANQNPEPSNGTPPPDAPTPPTRPWITSRPGRQRDYGSRGRARKGRASTQVATHRPSRSDSLALRHYAKWLACDGQQTPGGASHHTHCPQVRPSPRRQASSARQQEGEYSSQAGTDRE
ncbi:DUF222 domain-containing protein [Arthrobacter koreensis]|uniref:DUF222 domain-containing protein n=1 Tax=Arthrobacter koreensis TaxID=199136 RepID=UPI002DB73DD8|nr:DUF222 domain-containing protein [Arthrobacter koreensis]MEB7503581.1 13E12 repeat family protein [Arthrobacter koreensis]